MRKPRVLIPLAVLVCLAAGAAEARDDYILRFAGASVNPTGDLTVEESELVPLGDGTTLRISERVEVEADDAFAFCLDFERRVNDRLGVGLTLMRSDHDIVFDGQEMAQIVDDATGAVLFEATETVRAVAASEMTPLLVGANYHFTNNGKVDLYAGPFLGWIFFDDLDLLGERLAIEDDWAYGAVVGVDVPFGQGKLAFSGSLRYMIATATPDEPDPVDLDIDPWIAMVGLGYRF